jgi:hypothetical protein
VARWGSRRRGDGRDHGQRRAIEGGRQDGLNGVIAIFLDGRGAGAGGLEPRGADALREAQDALGAAEAIQRTLAEQGVDEAGAGGPDLGRPLATPRGALQEELDLVGRQVIEQGAALAGPGTEMGGDQRVLVEELDLPGAGPDPEGLANQSMRRRVVRAGEDDVAIGVELGPLPFSQLPGVERQRLERGALDLIEDLQRDALGRPVDPAAGDLDTPAPEMTIAVVDVAEGAPGERVALDVVDPALFDLPLVLGRPGPTGRDEEAVVFGELAIGALDLGIVEGGVDDRRPQIVRVLCPPPLCGRRPLCAARTGTSRYVMAT